jgi:hypothetical protein
MTDRHHRLVRGRGVQVPAAAGAAPYIDRRHRSLVCTVPSGYEETEETGRVEANNLVAGPDPTSSPQIWIGGGAVEIVDALKLQCAHGLTPRLRRTLRAQDAERSTFR